MKSKTKITFSNTSIQILISQIKLDRLKKTSFQGWKTVQK